MKKCPSLSFAGVLRPDCGLYTPRFRLVRSSGTLMRITVAVILMLATSQTTSGQELSIGHLETKDDTGINWLFFHCNQLDNSMSCDIFQTLISHKVELKDRDAEIIKNLTNDPSKTFKISFSETCKHTDEIGRVTDNAIKTGRGADGRDINVRQARDAKVKIDALINACRNPSDVNVRRFIEATVDQQVQTCRVINMYSKSTFFGTRKHRPGLLRKVR